MPAMHARAAERQGPPSSPAVSSMKHNFLATYEDAAELIKHPVRGGGGAGAGRTKAVQATRRKMAEGQEKRHEMRVLLFNRMRYIMHEIDETNGRFISSRTEHEPFQFLDVCCCPGGFSTYALTAGPAPRKGIGLSLPPDLGGHLPAIPLETEQYLLHFVDVTTVAAGVRVGDMGLEAAGCPRAALRLDAGWSRALLDQRQPNRPRSGRFTNMCGHIFAGVPCSGRCNSAHSFDELHPFVQKAFAEPRGFLHHPGSAALVHAFTVSSDPLPETLLALRQQAHMQAVHQAQAVAASQQAALAAVAAGGANADWGHLGSYDSAVQLGMGGEWVHGLMRQHQPGGGREEEAVGEDAAFQFFVADADTVMDGGFDEDEPEHAARWPPVRQPGSALPLAGAGAGGGAGGAGAAAGSVADEFSSAGAGAAAATAADEEEDRECAASAAAAVTAGRPGGGGGVPAIQPLLLRMSGYQPHWGLVAVEVQDDETLEAMLDYLGR
ncbi:hypothetical protein TSOC_002830 [Tetrabaena socialis]|uniref:Ribosomal RNA methyltransferase FtsJ domain-containing protein n=1 Tax=Tetrabaena socialis TaxID=47790 RepID=A0A2J8AD46_9CHLO|nr:hypothetical protein TSOC_002830 [Tetrabaena socialis]|eukprot:PNH10437.1 hypothetical protein TSOC_002830 [Tetrabaena socialis]